MRGQASFNRLTFFQNLLSPMFTRITRCFAISILCVSTAFAIDLTPFPSVRETDGVKFAELRFHDAAGEISYAPPRGWTYSGGGREIHFVPPKLSQAEGIIRVTPLTTPAPPLDEVTQKALKEAAMSGLPKDAQNVTTVAETKNSVVIDGHETYEVTFSYSFFGNSLKTSYLFAYFQNEQFCAEVSAHAADFDAVYRAFHGSLFSWQPLKKAPPVGVASAR